MFSSPVALHYQQWGEAHASLVALPDVRITQICLKRLGGQSVIKLNNLTQFEASVMILVCLQHYTVTCCNLSLLVSYISLVLASVQTSDLFKTSVPAN